MSPRLWCLNEKTWIVKNMYRLEHSINVQRLWSKEMGNNPPVRKTVRSSLNKFEHTGSVLNTFITMGPTHRWVSLYFKTSIHIFSQQNLIFDFLFSKKDREIS